MAASRINRGSKIHSAILDLARQDSRVNDELEIDDNAHVSLSSDNGCFVQAWMWVSFTGTQFDKEPE
jgi:hypothetical protein